MAKGLYISNKYIKTLLKVFYSKLCGRDRWHDKRSDRGAHRVRQTYGGNRVCPAANGKVRNLVSDIRK